MEVKSAGLVHEIRGQQCEGVAMDGAAVGDGDEDEGEDGEGDGEDEMQEGCKGEAWVCRRMQEGMPDGGRRAVVNGACLALD